ncbi:lantibiotic immunity ABC transporter MutG family permease subunit [Anaeromicropila herbilytica]|uniref:Multidrug ABC transporter permease n=1 Tax=Anaeromicropila herbilytica TaxID=2785025 RepID=A0A7R7ICR5_9FIRM|nr:lantibiotic immunity ABC transporter MutG family permease subunit [Anaeromicropila herbilytica]BCN30802.1 multidrug ABC transporter permease [Anaeromicropila herbilytica]
MVVLLRLICADLYKLRKTSLLRIHLFVPMIGAVSFLLYYKTAPKDTFNEISAFYEALAIAFPILIGLLCAMVMSVEEQAGNFQEMLTRTKNRALPFISKIITLLFLEIGALILALGIFDVGIQCFVRQKNFPIVTYIEIFFVLFIGNVMLYIIHLVLSFRFGKGVSIGLGIVGSLIEALMLTGIGDKWWKIIPYSWSARFVDYISLKQLSVSNYLLLRADFHNGILIAIVSSGVILILSILWFHHWDSKSSLE